MPPSACVPRRQQQVGGPRSAGVILAQWGRRLGEQVLALKQGETQVKLRTHQASLWARGAGQSVLVRAWHGRHKRADRAWRQGPTQGGTRQTARWARVCGETGCWAQLGLSQSNQILAGARKP